MRSEPTMSCPGVGWEARDRGPMIDLWWGAPEEDFLDLGLAVVGLWWTPWGVEGAMEEVSVVLHFFRQNLLVAARVRSVGVKHSQSWWWSLYQSVWSGFGISWVHLVCVLQLCQVQLSPYLVPPSVSWWWFEWMRSTSIVSAACWASVFFPCCVCPGYGGFDSYNGFNNYCFGNGMFDERVRGERGGRGKVQKWFTLWYVDMLS